VDSGGRGEQRRPGGEMDQVLNKVGSYWFSKRASKEIDSIGDDLNVRACALESFFESSLYCIPFRSFCLRRRLATKVRRS
jgi:hypothetical protein